MKKIILPVIILGLLTGCGKVVDSSGADSRITISSGTIEATSETETETVPTDGTTGTSEENVTTTSVAGSKINGTVTTAKKATTRPAVGNSSGGGVHGTVSPVPTAPRPATTTTVQPTTHDYRNQDNLSFSISRDNPGKILVRRDGSTFQQMDINTDDILPLLENMLITQDDIIIRDDFDFDGSDDLFIIETMGTLNNSGKYFRYNPDKGMYEAWEALNVLGYQAEILKDTSDPSETMNMLRVRIKQDNIEYEEKTFEWNDNKQLVLRNYMHQYKAEDDQIYTDYIDYDEFGNETSRETRDSNGNTVSSGGSYEE